MNKPVTTRWLKKQGACSDQVELFGRTFGESGELCAENVVKAAAAGLDLDWFAENWLPDTARAEYDRVMATAWAEYNRVMATAWAEYNRVTAPAWQEYERVKAPARAEFDRVTAPASQEYERVTATAWAE